MKKHILASLIAFASFTVAAQNIQVKDAGGNIINGQTIIKAGFSGSTVLQVDDIDIFNNNSVDMDIKMKRYEMSVQSGTGNSYCWSICTNEAQAGDYPVWSLGPVQPVGSQTSFAGFTADHYPHGVAGQNTYLYVWYDYANPNDSAALTITFDVALGQQELNAQDFVLSVYPNPASSTVYFNVDGNNTKDVKILLTDALGKTVKTIEVPETTGIIRMNVTDINPGIYFYTLQVNRKAISTRRLMITR
jgi:hypothetical protein